MQHVTFDYGVGYSEVQGNNVESSNIGIVVFIRVGILKDMIAVITYQTLNIMLMVVS